MKPFDLEKALAGEKVVTRDGREVGQIFRFDCVSKRCIRGVVDRTILSWYECGSHFNETVNDLDLFMAPKKLSGFICYHADGVTRFFKEKPTKEMYEDDLLLIIDLSQFEEGHGL